MKTSVIVWLLLCPCLFSCSEKPAEEQIRQHLFDMQEAIEKKNNAGVRDHLSDYFRAGKDGAYTIEKEDVRRMLAGYFLRYKNITVKLTKIEINQKNENDAKMKALALIAGAENLLPDNADLVTVEGEWVKESGKWHLKSFSWH